MRKPTQKADKDRKRDEMRRRADEHREEVVREGMEDDEGAEEMAKDILRKATDGEDRDVEEDEDLEEVAGGPLVPSDERSELSRRETEPDDAEADPEPNTLSEGP